MQRHGALLPAGFGFAHCTDIGWRMRSGLGQPLASLTTLPFCSRLWLSRASLAQRTMQTGEQEVMYQAPITEAHLMLGRVHIDIDYRRVDFQVEHKDRVTAAKQHITVSLTNGVSHQPVADHTAIDEKVLVIGLGP